MNPAPFSKDRYVFLIAYCLFTYVAVDCEIPRTHRDCRSITWIICDALNTVGYSLLASTGARVKLVFASTAFSCKT